MQRERTPSASGPQTTAWWRLRLPWRSSVTLKGGGWSAKRGSGNSTIGPTRVLAAPCGRKVQGQGGNGQEGSMAEGVLRDFASLPFPLFTFLPCRQESINFRGST